MSTIYLYKDFNNYINRKLKYYEDFNDYPAPTCILQDVNFNPADGVNTTIIFNYGDYNIDASCDYLLCCDEDDTIKSRWFIIEADRTNGCQYRLQLRRDVLADKWDKIKVSPMFIEKATLSSTSPFIYNHEDMDFNQIKKSEYLLKDKTGISWVIMYVAKGKLSTMSMDFTINGGKYKVDFSTLATHSDETFSTSYDIIALPLVDTEGTTGYNYHFNGTTYGAFSYDATLLFVSKLIEKYGAISSAAYIYDVQLVPYVPFNYNTPKAGSVWWKIRDNGEIDLQKAGDTEAFCAASIFNTSTSTAQLVSFCLLCPVDMFSFDIEYSKSVSNYKIENECDMYRLCSPNYSGQFEFNLAKNKGFTKFNVDVTYKPFNPYIHVNPDFGGLYGSDFDDARGLICGGDFSLPIVNDAWATYQRQNVNYQKMFDREIQNMDVHREWQKTEDIFNIATAPFTGGMKGAAAGKSFGMIGSAIGAGVGASVETAGATLDYIEHGALYDEDKKFKQDMFGYKLGNIKALPNSLSRVSSYNYNNRIFPFLEYYTCTDEEKDALAYKIRNNGMKVGVIGKATDYLSNNWSYNSISDRGYIKGQLIDLEELGEDTHMAEEIFSEMNKGVYTK